jgi:UDP-N-acetylmuramyl tripeptide synthase
MKDKNFIIHAFTGTNGKTSSAFLCHQLTRKQRIKKDSLYIGTLGTQLNEEIINQSISSKTTPDLFEYFEILKFYNLKDDTNICIEISSHALDQQRLSDIRSMASSALLNIGKDHLDYHKNISAYRDTKFQIFNQINLINLIDDGLKPSAVKRGVQSLISISNKNELSNIFYKIIESSIQKTIFEITTDKSFDGMRRKYKFSCSLFPEFNINNLVFAISSIYKGYDEFSEQKVNDLSYLKLPRGRSELINDLPKNIIIDYAHNPAGMRALKDFVDELDATVKVGIIAGIGDRRLEDNNEMGSIAAEMFDEIIIRQDKRLRGKTEEELIKMLNDGIKMKDPNKKTTIIPSEKEAITYAVKNAVKGSLIILCSDVIPDALALVQEFKEQDAKGELEFD